MVSENEATQTALDEALRMRRQANLLLNRLMSERDVSERRLAETGKRDPLKSVTGRTAMDSAIASTREMILAMDQLLAEMSAECDVLEPAEAVMARSVSASRVQSKSSLRFPGRLASKLPLRPFEVFAAP